MLDGCGLTQAGANLQGVGNVEDGAEPLYASTTGPGLSGLCANAGVATTQSRRMPNEDPDQINDEVCQIDSWTNKRSKIAKWAVSEVASASLVGQKPKRSCKSNDVLDGDRRDVDEHTRRVLDESDNECTSTTPSSFNLASLIYSTFFLDQIKSNSNLDLNLHKNVFRKFYYSQLI